jgi:RND superfamily putative drug exporter
VSFIVQYLLALIGLGVAIDYSLLVVTRWREDLGRGADSQQGAGDQGSTGNEEAVVRALATAGRSVLFSGITVAVSLAALIALPVPFLRSVGFTGLLIPLVSVAAALTLLPALLVVAGPKLAWARSSTTRPPRPARGTAAGRAARRGQRGPAEPGPGQRGPGEVHLRHGAEDERRRRRGLP